MIYERSKDSIFKKYNNYNSLQKLSSLGMLLCTIIIIIILLLTYYGQNVGSFTIDIDKNAFDNYGMTLSETIDFSNKTSRLVAGSYEDAEPIGNITSYPDDILPEDVRRLVDEGFGEGNQNGYAFIAYSFYLRNESKEAVNYMCSINIESVSKNLDSCIRVMLVKKTDVVNNTDEPTLDVYAKNQSQYGDNPGAPELGTTPFVSASTVYEKLETDMSVGQIDKYTVVLWTEGNDADTTNIGDRSILGGLIKLSMKFRLIKIE